MESEIKLNRQYKIFYGWVIVGVGFVAQMITGLSNQALGTYINIFHKEFGWSLAHIGLARSLSQAENALLGPVNGWLVDKFGARLNMGVGVFFFGLGLFSMGLMQSLWMFYASNILMALGTSMGSLVVISAAVNNWFRRRRTLAIAITTCGLATSGALLIPLIVFGQNQFGWRIAAIATGIGVWMIGIPSSLLLRQAPEHYGLLPDGDLPGQEEADSGNGIKNRSGHDIYNFTLKEAMHTRAFWLISFANAFSQLGLQAFVLYQFAHMEKGMGIGRGAAAFVVTVMSVFNFGGRLVGGVLGDMIPKHHLLCISMLSMGASLILLAISRSYEIALTTGAIFGLCWGIRTPVTHALSGDYFGRASFGKIAGVSSMFASPLGILGPLLVGALADAKGNFVLAFIIIGIISVLGAVMFSLASRPQPPSL
jgi:MFS family permease